MHRALRRLLLRMGSMPAFLQHASWSVCRLGMQHELYHSLRSSCIIVQIVMRRPDMWEEEHALWRRSKGLHLGFAKEYQAQQASPTGGEGNEAGTAGAGSQAPPKDLRHFNPVPRVTRDDLSRNLRSMRRQLDQRLYLLVKRRLLEDEDGPAAAGAGQQLATWRFPLVRHNQGESIR